MLQSNILYAAVSSIIAAAISAFVALRSKKSDILIASASNNSLEIQHIFDGYARIVEDLQTEVLRLQGELEMLRVEQQECDSYRQTLEMEVLELKHRIAVVEGRSNGD
jgi:TolA-binding protein